MEVANHSRDGLMETQSLFQEAKILGSPGDMALLGRLLDAHETAACFIDSLERIQSWNRKYEAFFPEHADQLRPGLSYEQNLRRYFENNIERLDPARFEEYVHAGLLRHRTMRDPLLFQKADGRWLQSRIAWFDDGSCLKTWADVTDLQNARLGAIEVADASSFHDIGFVAYDPEGRLKVANRKVNDLFPYCVDLFRDGKTYREHLQRHAEYALAETERPRIQALIEREHPIREPIPEPMVFRTRTGGWLRLEERRGLDGGLTTTWIDITEVNELNQANAALAAQAEELRQLAAELQQARDRAMEDKWRAEQASRAKSDFLAMMSHELRTPLNAVIGFSDVMEKQLFGPLGSPRYQEYAADINMAGRRLLSMINDVLDLSKIEAGRLSLRIEAVDLSAIVSESVALVSKMASAKRLTLTTSIDGKLADVRADGRALLQIVLNLLSNACKFTPEDGRISLAFEAAPEGLRLAVRDTGVGMTEAQIDKALELFGQVDNMLTRTQQGTGLGLPMVKRLTQLHGGKLTIDSKPGHGTVVMVEIPLSSSGVSAAA